MHLITQAVTYFGVLLIGIAIGTHSATCFPLNKPVKMRDESAAIVFWFGFAFGVAGLIGSYFV